MPIKVNNLRYDVPFCIVCHGYYAQKWTYLHGWDDFAREVRAGASVDICTECMARNPYAGMLSIADDKGGELTCCDNGQLTRVT